MARISVAVIRTWRSSRRYRIARRHYLNSHPLCAQCAADGYTVGADELDHILPVHKRADLFWDQDNWQGLCSPCHKKKSNVELIEIKKAQRRIYGSTIDGDPIPLEVCDADKDDAPRPDRGV